MFLGGGPLSSPVWNYPVTGTPPGAPTSVVGTDLGNGTISYAFVAPASQGSSPIIMYNLTAGAYTASGLTSPIIIAATPGVLVAGSLTATNSEQTGPPGTAAGVTPSRTVSTSYYLDNNGNDNNTGLSFGQAKRSSAWFNGFTFRGGDFVIFTSGQTYTDPGTFILPSSGTPGNLINIGTGRTVSSGTQVNPATIQLSTTGDGFTAPDRQHFWLDNLIISGPGVSAVDGTTTSVGKGVSIKSTQAATKLLGVQLSAVTVTGFKDAIVAWTDDAAKVGYENLALLGCIAHGNQRLGIITLNFDGTYASGTAAQNLNVTYMACQSYNQYGSVGVPGACGLNMHNVTNGLIDYGLAHHINAFGGPSGDGGSAAITLVTSDNSVIDRSEAHHVFAPNDTDGVGGDIDGGCTNCTIRRSYWHHNDGAGILFGRLPGKPNTGSKIYDNVVAHNSQNVATAHGGITKFNDTDGGVTCDTYNNTVYEPNGDSFKIVGNVGTITCYNSILVCKAGSKCVDGAITALLGNVYFAIGGGAVSVAGHTNLAAMRAGGYESYPIGVTNYGFIGDPLLASPGTAVVTSLLPAANSTLTNYKVSAGAPGKNAGVNISIAPFSLPRLTDFYGGAPLVGAAFDSGSHEFPSFNAVWARNSNSLVGAFV